MCVFLDGKVSFRRSTQREGDHAIQGVVDVKERKSSLVAFGTQCSPFNNMFYDSKNPALRSYLLMSTFAVKATADSLGVVLAKADGKTLTLEGVGFQVELASSLVSTTYTGETQRLLPDQLLLKVGYSHRIACDIPALVEVEVGRFEGSPACFRKGFCASELGAFVETVRGVKRPSVYKKRGVGAPEEWARPRKVVSKK